MQRLLYGILSSCGLGALQYWYPLAVVFSAVAHSFLFALWATATSMISPIGTAVAVTGFVTLSGPRSHGEVLRRICYVIFTAV